MKAILKSTPASNNKDKEEEKTFLYSTFPVKDNMKTQI